jgi:hypothetical protein
MQAALEFLKEAYELALELKRDPWDLALELEYFKAAGCTSALLYWLLHRGYMAHGVEIQRSRTKGRTFRKTNEGSFTDKSCFILTAAGKAFAAEIGAARAGMPLAGAPGEVASRGSRVHRPPAPAARAAGDPVLGRGRPLAPAGPVRR